MDATVRDVLWRQFGAAIDMLENAAVACPDALWSDVEREPQFWHLAYHTLFYLDLYLSNSATDFVPLVPFTLSELDPSGVMPERVCSKSEVLAYLDHCRRKARARISALTPNDAHELCDYGWIQLTATESIVYNIRHVQHHAAQLNLLLRQATNDAPRWVSRASHDLIDP
jgi:hypothetical protein